MHAQFIMSTNFVCEQKFIIHKTYLNHLSMHQRGGAVVAKISDFRRLADGSTAPPPWHPPASFFSPLVSHFVQLIYPTIIVGPIVGAIVGT